MLWTPVANATAYRIYRMASPTEPGLLRATVGSVEASKQLDRTLGMLAALDPDPGTKYWVDAGFSDGSSSAPGPIADVQVLNTGLLGGMPAPVPGLRVSVGGTTLVTMWEGQQVRGSKLTWSWDQIPQAPKSYVYFVTVQGSILGVSLALYTETIRLPEPPPFAIMVEGGVPGPPYTLSFPAGTSVKFCVSQMPIAQLVAAGRYTYGGQVPIACLDSQLPP